MSENNIEPSDKRNLQAAGFLFAVLAFAFAILLLTQVGTQVTWSSSKTFTNQPGFWPVMAICGMVVFGFFEVLNQWRSRPRNPISNAIPEILHWLAGVEFAVWFLAYVLIVPYLGYLGSTAIFAGLLTLRVGYRSRSLVLSAILTGIAIVIVFKSFLSVKIPGGVIYEFLPDAVRNFFIIYF